jgi:hypothetical protein
LLKNNLGKFLRSRFEEGEISRELYPNKMRHEKTKAGVFALTPCRWSEKRESSNLTQELFSFQVFDLNARKLFEFPFVFVFV